MPGSSSGWKLLGDHALFTSAKTNLYCGPERGKVTLPSSKVTRAEKGQTKRVEGGRRKEAIMSPACLSTKDVLRARLPDVFLTSLSPPSRGGAGTLNFPEAPCILVRKEPVNY